jgi:hypothetical protein
LVVYHVFAYAYMVPRICRLCLEAPVGSWYLQVLSVGGLGVLAYIPAWLLLNLIDLSSLPLAILTFVLGTILFAAGAYWLIDRDLRQTILRLPGSLISSRTSAV